VSCWGGGGRDTRTHAHTTYPCYCVVAGLIDSTVLSFESGPFPCAAAISPIINRFLNMCVCLWGGQLVPSGQLARPSCTWESLSLSLFSLLLSLSLSVFSPFIFLHLSLSLSVCELCCQVFSRLLMALILAVLVYLPAVECNVPSLFAVVALFFI